MIARFFRKLYSRYFQSKWDMYPGLKVVYWDEDTQRRQMATITDYIAENGTIFLEPAPVVHKDSLKKD